MNKRHVEIAVESGGPGRPLVVRVKFKGWLFRRTTELRVDDWGLAVSGDLGGYRSGTLRLPWEKVAELHYGPSGRGMPEGLYAREGLWCSRCLLPRLNEGEAETVIAAVLRQDPRQPASLESVRPSAVAENIFTEAHSRAWWLRWGRRHDPGTTLYPDRCNRKKLIRKDFGSSFL